MLRRKDKETDIAKQGYKGPTQVVSGLGEAAMHGKFLAITGFFLGGIGAFLFPKQANKVIEPFQNAVTKATQSENGLIKILGDLGKVTLDIGTHTADWFTSRKFIKNSLEKLDSKKLETGLKGAVVTSAVASTLGVFTGSSHGAMTARAGRKQVKELQTEVLNLRDDNNDLREKLVNTQSELEEEKAAHAHKKSHHHDDAEEHHHHKNGRWADSIAAEKAAQENAELSL